ncbi:MAG: MAPEG family protein [Novosphingobium sp.]
MQSSILTPAAALVVWSLAVMLWMMVTRFRALGAARIDLGKAPPGGRGQDLEGRIPDEVQWKAHNYAHLMEQPTLFYAAVLILALSGANWVDVSLAWAYTLIRVVHSLWQGTVNRIPARFGLFLVSSLCLIVLAVRALLATMASPLITL